jgi:inorganic pyrophosphatase
MNLWKDLPVGEGKEPEEIFAIIEIPRRSQNKYEYDPEGGFFKLDRVLFSPMFYPANYAFIPGTWSKDEDPLDIFVLSDEPIAQGCVVLVRPVALLKMIDCGEEDHKIIAVPVKDPRYNHINKKEDLNPHFLKEVVHFLQRYKELQDKKVDVLGWEDKNKALEEIKESIERFKSKFN